MLYQKLMEERDRAWEERKELLLKMKNTRDKTERDKIFERYMDLELKIQDINKKIKLTVNELIEVEMFNYGVLIRTPERYGGVLIPFDDFEKIVRVLTKSHLSQPLQYLLFPKAQSSNQANQKDVQSCKLQNRSPRIAVQSPQTE